jgi:hypothetical protein
LLVSWLDKCLDFWLSLRLGLQAGLADWLGFLGGSSFCMADLLGVWAVSLAWLSGWLSHWHADLLAACLAGFLFRCFTGWLAGLLFELPC